MTVSTAETAGRDLAAAGIAPELVRAQLARILASDDFVRSERLARFLAYVVEETLAERSRTVSGRIIGEVVFDRGPDFDPQSDTIVRVEAGRLRRRLHHYFATVGSEDPIRIEIPKGAYVPLFERVLAEPTATPGPAARASSLDEAPPAPLPPPSLAGVARLPFGRIGALVAALLILGGLAAWLWPATTGPEASGARDAARRFTTNDEAYALFLEVRAIGRPPSNRERVQAALDLAHHVIELDPEFAGGYAAASFALWQWVVFGHSTRPADDIATATRLAEQAVAVDPRFGWGHVSLSRARHLTGDLDGAVAAALAAVERQPEVPEMHGNLGLIQVLAGAPREAIGPLHEAIRLAGERARTPYWNYLGIAFFHAGRYAAAIEALETNRARGGPVGPHMYAYLAAAYARNGDAGKARAAIEKVRAGAPAFPLGTWIERMFAGSGSQRQLLSALAEAGLRPVEI